MQFIEPIEEAVFQSEKVKLDFELLGDGPVQLFAHGRREPRGLVWPTRDFSARYQVVSLDLLSSDAEARQVEPAISEGSWMPLK